MRDLFTKNKFSRLYEFEGKLSNDKETLDKLHMVLEYSLVKAGEIVGRIVGNQKTSMMVLEIKPKNGLYLKLTKEKQDDFDFEILSEKVLLKSPGLKTWGKDYGENINYVVADLICTDLTITTTYESRESHERHLNFFLTGPRKYWLADYLRKLSFTGETETESRNQNLELNENLPIEVEIIPYYFYDRETTPISHELTTNVLSLHIKTIEPIENLSDGDLCCLGKEIADDLCLLVSFLSRSRVTWFRFDLISKNKTLNYIRNVKEWSTKEPDQSDEFIQFSKTRDFLKIGLRNLRKLRDENINVQMAIVYFVSGNEARYGEEQFTNFFFSLEKIIDMFATKEGLTQNLSNDSFENLRLNLINVINANVRSNSIRSKIEGKIKELNRPSLRFVLRELLSKYNVDYKDLYPDKGRFSLISTRAKLFHTSKEMNSKFFIKELYRLRTILERLLLRMLGWEDISYSPNDFIKDWLTKPISKD
ncbi:hypothetical protein MYX76_09045 [Desulfobacterota bacterium AH_259_B03_O07]|nr:hypothetical protein [Desulfobacterota bacterium AH_259_B03_O07]